MFLYIIVVNIFVSVFVFLYNLYVEEKGLEFFYLGIIFSEYNN